MEHTEGNKLINDLRGLKLGMSGYVNDYHTNWNSLMTVVEGIEKNNFEVAISSQMEYINDDQEIYWHQDVCISDSPSEIINVSSGSKIESVWEACAQFAQWYKTNTP